MGVPLRRVVHRVQAARDERYASLRGFFHGASDIADDTEHAYVRLHSVTLKDDAAAVGRCIAELGLDELEVEVTAVRRGNERIEPDQATELRSGDVVVLRGTGNAVTRAEGKLLR
jgi:CPA2 family monovalent cation:H+ antiporter-2